MPRRLRHRGYFVKVKGIILLRGAGRGALPRCGAELHESGPIKAKRSFASLTPLGDLYGKAVKHSHSHFVTAPSEREPNYIQRIPGCFVYGLDIEDIVCEKPRFSLHTG